jgi:hypothetical protein
MDPFVRRDPPAEYTIAEWRCQDTSIVAQQNLGGITVAVWVWAYGDDTIPEVLTPEWCLVDTGAPLEVIKALARVLGPLVTTTAPRASWGRALHLLAMRDYGDVYNGSQVKLYKRTSPRGDNPWRTEIAELEREMKTGIRRHSFSLNLEAPPLQETLFGTARGAELEQ